MTGILAFVSILIASSFASAQEVIPIFDDASFRIGLTIPFAVKAVKDDATARIHRLTVVDSAGAGKCVAMQDPKIAANFLLKCENVATIRLKILVARGDQASEISYGPIQIKELKAGYREPTPSEENPVDPEIALGRAILYSKAGAGGVTCVGCHANPGKYSRIMTATLASLKMISSVPAMSGVPNLSETEAKRVLKYLGTVKDMGEWP